MVVQHWNMPYHDKATIEGIAIMTTQRRSRYYLSELLMYDRTKINWIVGGRNALGIGLAVILGILYLPQVESLALIVGALQTSFHDDSDAYEKRAARLFSTTFFSAVAVIVAGYVSHYPYLTLGFITLGAFAVGMSLAVSSRASDLSVIVLVTFLMFSAHPMSHQVALRNGIWIFLGGMIQATLSLVLWQFRRYRPEQRALGVLFKQLIPIIDRNVEVADIPFGSTESIRAQETLSVIAKDPRDTATRYRSLLSQAERVRLALITLSKLRHRSENAADEILLSYCSTLGLVLEGIADILDSGKDNGKTKVLLGKLDDQVNLYREKNPEHSDILFQMYALAGMLRACAKVASSAIPTGELKNAEREASKPLKLRFLNPINGLIANLSFKSVIFKHAFRMALCILIGESIALYFKFDRPYWVPMTILLVLKPAFSTTLSRGGLRVGGTLAGLILATALVHWLPFTPVIQVALVMIFTFICRSVGAANYGVYAVGVSALIVVLFSIAGVPATELIWWRGVNTLLGGGIALASYWIWPTSERKDVPPLLAQLLGLYREYTRLVFESETLKTTLELDEVRRQCRTLRFNLKTMIARAIHEKNMPETERELLTGVLATSNRFVHSVMGVESVPAGSIDRAALMNYRDGVLKTLQTMIDYLAASNTQKEDFNLRSLYLEMLPKGDGSKDLQKAFLVEVDEMTDSLNTLRELVYQMRA